MAVPDDFTIVFPATISTSGEANGVLISLPRPGANEQQSIGIYGTYGTAVLVIEARQLGMTQFYPIGVLNVETQTTAGTGGSITLTDDGSYLFVFGAGNYDAVNVYASALATGSIHVEQASGPFSGQPINVTTSSSATTSGTLAITSTSANALAVGANGATNPVLNVNASTGSVATGITIVGAASGAGVAITVTSSGSDDALAINAKGTGGVTIGATSTGNVVLGTSGHTLTLNNSTGAVTLAAGGLTLTTGNVLLSAGTLTVTSANASALAVGRQGASSPGLLVDASTSTCVTGVKVTPAASGAGVAIIAVGGATDELLSISGKGAGVVTILTQLCRTRQNTPKAAAGTNVGTATALLTADVTLVSSDGSGKGWILPTGVAGSVKVFPNTTGTAGILYPATGGTINGLSANAGVIVAASKTTIAVCTAADTWWTGEYDGNTAA